MTSKTLQSLLTPEIARLRGYAPGVLLCVTVAMAAQFLAKSYQAPVMLFALLLGISFNFLTETEACQKGIEFCSKKFLRIGVVLLAVRITLDDIMSLGYLPIIMVIVGVLTTIAFGVLLSRIFGMNRGFGILSGGSVAICGASAALAISSILPDNRENRRLTIFTVVSVTALSTIAMIAYPILSGLIGYSYVQSGIFLGGTIHDVAQVVGAGYSISDKVGDLATFVKLLRVAMLIPVIVLLSVYMMRKPGSHGSQAVRVRSIFPLFLLGFIAVLAINSMGHIPDNIRELMASTSSWLLVIAISALGVNTSLKEVFSLGWVPFVIVLVETLYLGGLFVGGIYVLDIH